MNCSIAQHVTKAMRKSKELTSRARHNYFPDRKILHPERTFVPFREVS